MNDLYAVRLPDGTEVSVNKRTAAAIESMKDLQMELARGIVGALVVSRVLTAHDDADGLLVYFEPDRLHVLGKSLAVFGRRCEEIGSLWEGNAPIANRTVVSQ